jgi:hypothetical protein
MKKLCPESMRNSMPTAPYFRLFTPIQVFATY